MSICVCVCVNSLLSYRKCVSESRDKANRPVPNKDSVSCLSPVGIALQGSECREVRERDLNPNHMKPLRLTFLTGQMLMGLI